MENIKEIHDRMLTSINDEYDKTEGSFFYDATKPAAIEFENSYKKLNNVKSKLDVENLIGEELEIFISQRTGIIRKPATKAIAIVNIFGSEGSSIKEGDMIASDTVNFISLENKTIDSTGEITVLVECEEAGTIGNVPVGAIKHFPTTIPGLVSVTNLEAATNGYDAEGDFDLRQRYYERIRTPATSGNKYHYLNWAKEVVGVGDARIISLWNGDNTVKVIIIDSNKQVASTDLIEATQNYIDPKGEYIVEEDRWTLWGTGAGQAPIGAFCTVVSAIGKSINVVFTVTRDANYTIEQVLANVENNVREYLKSIAFKEDTVSYAKVGAIILGSDGVLDYENLTINGATSNIAIGYEEVAVLGEVTINE